MGMTNTSNDIIGGKFSIGSQFIENVTNLINKTNLFGSFWNSIYISLITVFFSVLLGSMAAYGIQMFKSKGKNFVYRMLMLTMMIPFAVLMIPRYRLFARLSMLNSLWSVILPTIVSVFIIFFFYQNLENFPIDTIESARLDGAKEWYIFLRVVVPQLKSTFATATIMTFTTVWNTYMWPLVALQTEDKRTLPLLLSSLASKDNYIIDYGPIMVLIVLSTLPVFILFVTLQKYFVQSMVGSTK
jgi:lactose/L-arabinose transport system permease protein